MTKTQSNLTLADVIKAEGGDDVISKAELDLLKADAAAKTDLTAQLADLEKAKDAMATQLADLQKAKDVADAALADVEKAKHAAKITDTTDVLKGLNLIDEDKIEDVAKFLVANEDNSTTALILTTLEKARAAIQEFGEVEHGTDLEGVQLESDDALSSAVSDIIKSRKAK